MRPTYFSPAIEVFIADTSRNPAFILLPDMLSIDYKVPDTLLKLIWHRASKSATTLAFYFLRWGKRGRHAYLLDKSDLVFLKVSEGSWPNNSR
jgi:hypothetical protein